MSKQVLVNMNPRGRIHDPDCPWLNGRWRIGPWPTWSTPFKLMPASATPAGKKHCKVCA